MAATVHFFDGHWPPESGELTLGFSIAFDDGPGVERGQMREVVRPAIADDCIAYAAEYQAYVEAGGALKPAMPPTNVDVPAVVGTGAVGEVLTCTMGNWEGEPASYAYQWCRDAMPIALPGGDSYTVAGDDSGHSITCIVSATNAVGTTAAPPSNAVAIGAATRSAASPGGRGPAQPPRGDRNG